MTDEIAKHDYYYGGQIKRYINQFAQVFSEMYVTVGKNDSGSATSYVRIPMYYGSPDRVVSSLKAENTQNKPIRVPAFTIKLEELSLALDRKSGTNTEYRYTVFPVGGDIKKDLRAVYKLKPLPYSFTFSVTALTSNSDQMFQILEQILLLFDPMLQFQSGDARHDWTKIIDAELTAVEIEDNRSQDTDGRILQTRLGFVVRAYMSPPANIKDNVIKAIRLRVEAIAGSYNTEEYVADQSRDLPEYEEIFNLDNSDAPSA